MAAIPLPTLTMGASPGAPKLVRNVTDRVMAIFYQGTGYRLRRPITLSTLRDNGYWIHQYAPLGITAYGRTKGESLQAFAQEFSSAWHWIGQESDDKLGPDAQQLKRKLQRIVAEAKPIGEAASQFREFVDCKMDAEYVRKMAEA